MMLYWIIIIGIILPLFCLAVWVLAIIFNKIFPRFSQERYFLILFSAPFVIEFIRVLAAFIVPDFGGTMNLMAIYRQAQFTTGLHRDLVEVKAATLAKKRVLSHHPIGSDADSLVNYLIKSEITCPKTRMPKGLWLNKYCYYEHWHPERFGITHWYFHVVRNKDNKILELTVHLSDEVD